jgi:hypothetical protein
MQADHRVQPHDDEKQRLAKGEAGPKQRQQSAVGIVKAVERAQAARRGDMRGGEERDGEAEGDLGDLPWREAPGAPKDQFAP